MLLYIYFCIILPLFPGSYEDIRNYCLFLEFPRRYFYVYLKPSTFYANILWPVQALFVFIKGSRGKSYSSLFP